MFFHKLEVSHLIEFISLKMMMVQRIIFTNLVLFNIIFSKKIIKNHKVNERSSYRSKYKMAILSNFTKLMRSKVKYSFFFLF